MERVGFTEGVQYEIPGSDAILAQSWVVQFEGDVGLATRLCRTALTGLQFSRGHWDEVWAVSPLERWIQVFISPDKNQQRQATEIGPKRLQSIVEAKLPERAGPLHAMRQEGVLFVNWIPLVKIVPSSYELLGSGGRRAQKTCFFMCLVRLGVFDPSSFFVLHLDVLKTICTGPNARTTHTCL